MLCYFCSSETTHIITAPVDSIRWHLWSCKLAGVLLDRCQSTNVLLSFVQLIWENSGSDTIDGRLWIDLSDHDSPDLYGKTARLLCPRWSHRRNPTSVRRRKAAMYARQPAFPPRAAQSLQNYSCTSFSMRIISSFSRCRQLNLGFSCGFVKS